MENKFDNTNPAVETATANEEPRIKVTPEDTKPAAETTAQPELYVQPVQQPAHQQYMQPIRQLKSNRGMLKTILLTILTLGIYGLVVYTQFSDEINVTASRYDGKKTMNYCLLFFLVGPITLEIGTLIWFHRFSTRVGDELKRRNIDFKFGAGSFWGWNILGLLILVGPFVYLYKLCKAMNLINADYNQKG